MRKTRFSSIAVLSALFLVIGIMAAAPAFAAATCTIPNDDFETMNIALTEGTAVTIVRADTTNEATDDKILVNVTGGLNDICTGQGEGFYTVFDIDTINVSGTGSATIDLSGGQFAPGFNTEIGTDEIEFFVTSGVALTISGTSGVDNWTFGQSATDGGPAGVGLNSDSDPDILSGTESSPATLAAASVTANGLAGNDTFEQEGVSTETLNGGLGTDTVDYSARIAGVTVTIGAGANDGEPTTELDDVGADVETVIGGSGDDNISAPTTSTDRFRLEGGAGTDVLTGGAGRDRLFGGAGTDTLNGGDGRDILNGGADADIENGQGGSDVFDQERESNGGDTLNGGTDTGANPKDVDVVKYNLRTTAVTVTVGADKNDGAAAETDDVGATIERVNGGKGDDNLMAAANGTKLFGGAGNDTLTGGNGNDRLVAGAGNDDANGAAGDDYLSGGSGNDTLLGGAGNDNLNGSAGNDELNGQAGKDRVSGGSGDDKLWGDGNIDKVKDTVVGGSGTDDKCERDLKDVRSGCEGRIASSSAPTTI